jgi:hypothetical protein
MMQTVRMGVKVPASSPEIAAGRLSFVARKTIPPTISIPKIPVDNVRRHPFMIFISEVY